MTWSSRAGSSFPSPGATWSTPSRTRSAGCNRTAGIPSWAASRTGTARAEPARPIPRNDARPPPSVTDDPRLPEHVRRNRALWDAWAADYAAAGARAWARAEPTWGVWRVPESQLGVLPPDLAGRAGIELGCGTAYVSAWLARRGVKMVGLDASPAQLATARRLQREHGLEFALIEADAERVPCRGEAFDLA